MSKWDNAKNAAKDAISSTLNNKFDVLSTAKELNDKYGKDEKKK